MSQYTNIDCFNISSALIISKLYNSFPKPVKINSSIYQDELIKDNLLPQECSFSGAFPASGNLTSFTLNYLIEEGLIRSKKSENSVTYENLVLSSKGFTILNQPVLPENQDKKSIGAHLSSITEHTTKSTIASAISTIFKSLSS